jgi:hypothetical protein
LQLLLVRYAAQKSAAYRTMLRYTLLGSDILSSELRDVVP